MSIVWQRAVGSAFVWVRPDDVVAVEDELVDLATGRVREEPPWPFLDTQPWSRQSWEPRIVGVGEQGPGMGCDKVEARRWRDLLVVGRNTTDVDVFHVSRTGLALARRGGVLTCLSLPAMGALAAPASG